MPPSKTRFKFKGTESGYYAKGDINDESKEAGPCRYFQSSCFELLM